MGVTQGIKPARAKRGFSVPETRFLVPAGDRPLMRLDIGSDGNGLSRVQNWVESIPDGSSAAAGRALTGEEGVLTRNWLARYRLCEPVFRCVAGLPTTDVNIDAGARRKIVWTFPDVGAPPIETQTWYYGLADGNVAVLKGGKVRSLNLDTMRNGDGGNTTGNIEYHFNWVERTGSLPGATPQSEVKRIVLNGATGNGTLVVGASGLGAGGNVTVTPGMSTSALQTALAAKAAIASGANVAVTGSSVSGANVATGGTASTDAGAINGAAANVFDGTYDATLEYDEFTGSFGQASAFTVWVFYNFAASKTPKLVRVWAKNQNVTSVVISGGPTNHTGMTTLGTFSGLTPADWVADGAHPGLYKAEFVLNNTTAYPAIKVLFDAPDNQGSINISEITVHETASGAGEGTYTVTFQGALANTDIADWSISGTGYSTNTQTQGSEGGGPLIPTGPYIRANHRRVYLATSDADLNSIDMTDMPDNEGAGGDPHLLASAYASGWSMADLYNVFYSHNGLIHATDFVPGAQNIGAFITMPADPDPLSDCEWLENTAYGCAATGFWVSFRDVCGGFELWVDIYVTRTEAPGYGADNDVDSRTFNFGRCINPSGGPSMRITLILPTA